MTVAAILQTGDPAAETSKVKQDYFSSAPSPSPGPGHGAIGGPPWDAPPPMQPAWRSPRRRVSPGFRAMVALLAVLTAGGVVAVERVQAVPELRHVSEPAPASAGWGPSWVDENNRPARWDPCTPIAYVVNPAGMPDNGRRDLAEALRRISEASGLQFVDEGDTDEAPSRSRAAYQPGRYGERWAPLLVGWVSPAATDVGLGNGVQGVSLTVAVPGKDGGAIVSGQVALNADRRLASGFGPGDTEGEVLLHELAHAVGLGHVLDPTQVMYPQTTNSDSVFGAGDRAGLTALGAAAGCRPAPPPRPLRIDPGATHG